MWLPDRLLRKLVQSKPMHQTKSEWIREVLEDGLEAKRINNSSASIAEKPASVFLVDDCFEGIPIPD